MVRLEEVEDESFLEKPASSKDDVLLADDDADYTDTGETTRNPPNLPSATATYHLASDLGGKCQLGISSLSSSLSFHKISPIPHKT